MMRLDTRSMFPSYQVVAVPKLQEPHVSCKFDGSEHKLVWQSEVLHFCAYLKEDYQASFRFETTSKYTQPFVFSQANFRQFCNAFKLVTKEGNVQLKFAEDFKKIGIKSLADFEDAMGKIETRELKLQRERYTTSGDTLDVPL